MPSAASSPERPPIIISRTDADRLSVLAEQFEQASPVAADLLMGEIERADIRPDGGVPADVAGIDAVVEFVDEARDTRRTVQLVFPDRADIAAGKISVLTPVGAGLVGLRPGQSIDWPDREGRTHRLRVVSVARPPEAPAA
jgi:regulator of nucleoside diphosphate kinase